LIDLEDCMSLTNIACHGARLTYFHDLECQDAQGKIDSGVCVVDALAARARRVRLGHGSFPKQFTSADFYIDWFKTYIKINKSRDMTESGRFEEVPWTESDGITIDELNMFVDSPEAQGIMSLYVITPDERMLVSNIQKKSRMSIAVRINGKHVYLLERKNLHKVKSENFCSFTSDWPRSDDTNSFIVLNVELDANTYMELKSSIIACGMNSEERSKIVFALTKKYGSFLPVRFSDHSISELKLPDGRFIQFRHEKKLDIRNAISIREILAEKNHLPVYGTISHHPRMTEITRWYFYNMLGDFPQSNFNTEVGDLFETFKRGGVNEKATNIVAGYHIEVDESKAYTNALVSNTHPWCVFDVLDQRVRFDTSVHILPCGSLQDGWYVARYYFRG
jgi:hypothetical protein